MTMTVAEHGNGTSAAGLDAAAIAGLARLAARADDIVALLDLVGAGLARGPEIAENVNGLVQIARDAVGGGAPALGEIGAAASRARTLLASDSVKTLETALADPQTGANLAAVLARAPDLLALVDIVAALLRRGPEIADNVSGLVGIARNAQFPIDLSALVSALGKLDYVGLVQITNTLYPILASPQVQTLLTRTSILSEPTLALVNAAATTALEAQHEVTARDTRTGPLGSLKALGDPDVQRAVGFVLSFAKRFGAALRTPPKL